MATPDANGWLPISAAVMDGKEYLFFSPGNRSAGNKNASKPHIHVDFFSERWPRAVHQYPEAPYTHYQPIPKSPVSGGAS